MIIWAAIIVALIFIIVVQVTDEVELRRHDKAMRKLQQARDARRAQRIAEWRKRYNEQL